MTEGGRAASAEAELARVGLHAASAIPPLTLLGAWPPAVDDSVLRAVAAAADPQRALDTLASIAEAGGRLEDGQTLHRAALLAGASGPLGAMVAQEVDLLEVVSGDLGDRAAGQVHDEAVGALETASDPRRALLGVQRRTLLRIALRDLLGLADTADAARELADLAAGILGAALHHLQRGRRASSLAIVGMGKLGGRELNYVSDIDVMFVHDGDLDEALRTARAVMELVGGSGVGGRIYEIDANLRPEGRNGPLSRTIDAYVAYYDRWAKTWEFQALLKARALVGDPDLQQRFDALVTGSLWEAPLGPEAVEEVQHMKGRIERSRAVQRDGERQVKLAPGGLRDIEFAVQLLQLVHGPMDPSLRSPTTLVALRALAKGGYVDEGDANLFADAYLFLRTVEHRLQLDRLARTHTLPDSRVDRTRIAKAVGFRDIPASSALDQFDAEITRVRAAVRRLHEKLFYRPLLDVIAAAGPSERDRVAGGLGREAALARLRALGFSEPVRALDHVQALTAGSRRTARLLKALLPPMMAALAESPDPDGGLAALDSLGRELRESPAFQRVLRDHPPAAVTLAGVLGRSKRMGEWLHGLPDVLLMLAHNEELDLADPDAIRGVSAGLVRRGGGATSADVLRRFARRHVARTALRDLTGRADVTQVATELTVLGEASLDAAVSSVVPDGARLAVIGMGRFGAGELGYGSDLDAILVFDPPEARDEVLRAAEELLEMVTGLAPSGTAFKVDLGLRPEGRQGVLARSLDATVHYYERWGSPWEFLALTQARPVAGDAELGAAFLERVHPLVFTDPVDRERVTAIRKMKARVEKERSGGGAGKVRRQITRVPARSREPVVDLKLGEGGLSDIEWTVQLLQLLHGARVPELRGTGTLPLLAACAEAGLLAGEEAAWLRDGYVRQSRVRNALYLGAFDEVDLLPRAQRELRRLARMLGSGSIQQLQEDLDRARRRVRRVHERRFYA